MPRQSLSSQTSLSLSSPYLSATASRCCAMAVTFSRSMSLACC
uniref:Uncharacterized protein n=1 Tax=Arundo donax TaxID=35708 RepID=A0A0A8ZN53_ARUDO